VIETLIVAAIVLGALLYLGIDFARKVRSARASRAGACGSSCGCSDH